MTSETFSVVGSENLDYSAEPQSHETDPVSHAKSVMDYFQQSLPWESFSEHKRRKLESMLAESQRIEQTVRDFSLGKHEAEAVYAAAYLEPIMRLALQPEGGIEAKLARNALLRYGYPDTRSEQQQEPSEARLHFTAIALDINLISKQINQNYSETLRDCFRPLFTEGRSDSYPIMDIGHILNLLSLNKQAVNIESVLIGAASAYNRLRDQYEAEHPNEVLVDQLLYSIESFYAPVCEVIRFDALAAALRDYALRMRIRYQPAAMRDDGTVIPSGQDRLKVAGEIIASLGDSSSISCLVNDAVELTGFDAINAHAINDTSGHGMNFGLGQIEIHKAPAKTIKFRWRVKSIGSLANKLSKHDNPHDIIGITIVPGDKKISYNEDEEAEAYAQVARILQRFNDNLSTSQTFRSSITPSKTRPFSVEGDERFIRVIQDALGEDCVHTTISSNGFRVGKVTFVDAEGRRYEIQVQTSRDRICATIGTASHIFFKSGDKNVELSEADIAALHEISERKLSPDEGPTDTSRERALTYLDVLHPVQQKPPSPVGEWAVAATLKSGGIDPLA